MHTSTQRRIGIGAAILITALIALFVYNSWKLAGESAQAGANATSTLPENATSSQGIAISGSGDYTVNFLPVTDAEQIKAPNYLKPIVFASSLSASERTAIQTGVARAQADIKKDALDFNAWISLGTLNLMAGDYATARTIWEYASAAWPKNYVSYNNLGDLYANYLKDFPKAEANFLKGIQYKPDDTNPYRNLFTLYSETSYKPSNTAAEDILKKGIAAVPRGVDLQVLLARYYNKLGRSSDATAMYNAAIANAERQGLTSLATSIRTEMTQ